MYSQCPKCQVVFNVSSPQLGAHRGLVRCGYCQAVFNARDNATAAPAAHAAPSEPEPTEPEPTEPELVEPELVEPEPTEPEPVEPEPVEPEPVEPEPVEPEPVEPEPVEPEPVEPEPVEPEPVEPEPVERDRAASSGPAAPDVADGGRAPREPAVPRNPPAQFPGAVTEEITIEAPFGYTLNDDPGEWEGTAPASRPGGGHAADKSAPPVERGAGRGRVSRLLRGRDIRMVELPRPRSLAALLLGLASVALALVLLWQVKAFYLTGLAQYPLLRPYLSLMCRPLSCTLPPRQDIGEVDLVGTSIDVNPAIPGALEIRVSLANRAGFAQPYPPLRITLTDREGRIVGRRTYQASEYQPGAGGATQDRQDAPALLPTGSAHDVSINLAQPAENAVGYEVELVAPAGG